MNWNYFTTKKRLQSIDIEPIKVIKQKYNKSENVKVVRLFM